MGGITKTKSALLLTAALLFFGFAHAEDYAVQVIGPFGNLNNTDSSFVIPSDRAQDLLNVDISPNGKSVKKRKGYSLFSDLSITTSAVHGIYNFYDSNGTDISLFFNDTRMSASSGGGAVTVLFSTGPNGATYQCVDSQGFAYCANTTRNTITKTNGAVQTTLQPAATGYLIAVTPDRLVISGSSDFPNRIDFSKGNDFTVWTLGGNPADPVNFTITAPGAKVTHITYAFNRVMWFKDSSFGYILAGATLSDWQVRTISPNVGTLDNSSTYWDGILYFRGQDGHFYSYDGSSLQKLSRDIQATITTSQTRTSNSWSQTSQADFQASSITPAGYLNTTILAGSVVLDTGSAPSPFSDTSESDFSAGTLTNTSATQSSGDVQLLLNSAFNQISNYSADSSSQTNCPTLSSSFEASEWRSFRASFRSFQLTSARARISRKSSALSGGCSGTTAMYAQIYTDTGSHAPLSLLATSNDVTTPNCTDTPTDVDFTFSSKPSITVLTRYWLKISIGSSGSPSNCGVQTQFYWTTMATPDSEYDCTGSLSGCSPVTPSRTKYQINGSTYSDSGSFFSRSFDVAFTTDTWLWNWSTFSTTSTIPPGTSLTFETQTSSSSSGPWDSLVSVSTGNSPTSTVREFIRYKASFSGNESTTPTLSDVVLAIGTRLRPGGTFYSQVKNAASLATWDTFQVTKQDNGGAHLFSIRSATGAFSIGSSTPTNWVSLTAGAVPTVSTGSYFQIKDVFSAASSTANPTLNSFTQNWFEGSATDKAYATYHRDAIWWAVASGTGATTNNRILRLDLLNPGWTLYDIPMAGMFVRNQALYFGSVSAGKIYKFGDTDNDDGVAINAYWKSKDYFADSPFMDKEITNISFIGATVANSSMTVTYALNGSSTTAFGVPLYSGSTNFVRSNKNLPAGRVGNTFNIKFGNNAADQPFEIFAVQFGYRTKPWAAQ